MLRRRICHVIGNRSLTTLTLSCCNARVACFANPDLVSLYIRRNRPVAAGRDDHDAAAQFPQNGHTCIVQHYLVSSVCDAGRSGQNCRLHAQHRDMIGASFRRLPNAFG